INKAANDKLQNSECPQLNKHDDLYLDRMQVLHNVMRCISNGNFKAPINEKLVEATWLSEMASDFPNSTFIGIEKIPTLYPDQKPRNIRIIQTDALETFPFPECVEGDIRADNPGVVTEQLRVVGNQSGRSLTLFTKFGEMLESQPQMGKVTKTEFAMPIGSWGGQIGELGLAIMLHMLSGMQKGIMHYMKLNEKDLDKLWDDYKTE
ncbi:4018_t:CDS:2, partial [Racocetra fulgida]